MYGLVSNLMQRRSLNERIKLSNGQLDTVYEWGSLTTYAEKIVELSSFLSSRETDMLYVQLPSKYDGDASLLPPGTTDNRNERTDGFLQVLGDSGVSCMDLRDNIKDEGIHQYDLFFVTDHHWNPKGAFWGYSKVMEYLKENYDVSVDSKATRSYKL